MTKNSNPTSHPNFKTEMRRVRRRRLVAAGVLSTLALAPIVATAVPPQLDEPFVAGTPISAGAVNDAFNELYSALNTAEENIGSLQQQLAENPPSTVAVLREVLPNGAVPTAFGGGIFNARDLSIVTDAPFFSLSFDDFITLDEGRYEISYWSSAAPGCSQNYAALYDVTPEPDLALDVGSMEHAASGGSTTRSVGTYVVEVESGAQLQFQLSHWAIGGCDGGVAFADPANLPDVHAEIVIRRHELAAP